MSKKQKVESEGENDEAEETGESEAVVKEELTFENSIKRGSRQRLSVVSEAVKVIKENAKDNEAVINLSEFWKDKSKMAESYKRDKYVRVFKLAVLSLINPEAYATLKGEYGRETTNAINSAFPKGNQNRVFDAGVVTADLPNYNLKAGDYALKINLEGITGL